MNNSQLKCHWLWLDLSMTSKVKFYQVIWKAMYDLLYVFHTNFHHTMYRFWDIGWHRSQRSQIGPFWPWKWPLEWFHTFHILGQDWFHNKKATWCNKFGQCYYWIISIIMGKWAKPELSYLENDLLNNSMKSISWQLINIIPKKLHTRYKEKLSGRFWVNWQKVAKTAKFDIFQTFWTLKNDL